MAWTIYRSTDGSAPTLNGTAGSLVTLLDAILVNGYGSKGAAGWTKPYSGTNKAAYRNGAGATARKYIRVQDDAAGTGGAREARVRGYDAMSDVDTGTTPFPTGAQQANAGGSLVWRKSNTADSTARAWIAFADERTLVLFVYSGDSGTRYLPLYAGEYQSNKAGDAHAFALLGASTEVTTTLAGNASTALHANNHFPFGSAGPTSSTRIVVAGNLSGGASSLQCCTSGLPYTYLMSQGTNNKLQYPNGQDNGLWLSPIGLVSDEAGVWCARGQLRGVYLPCQTLAAGDGDTASGAGELAGMSFVVVYPVAHSYGTGLHSTHLFISSTAPDTTP